MLYKRDDFINLLITMNHKMAILYGVGIWAFTFVVAMLIFPIRAGERALFESIMPVALSLAVVIATVRYFRRNQASVRSAFCAGLIWLGVNLAIDALMFSWGPMKMSVLDYVKDIGVTYLMIPVIATGYGFLANLKK